MPKILYIDGDGDLGAMALERTIGYQKAAQLAIAAGGRLTIEDDENEVYVDLVVKDFGEVDEKFITWVFDMFVDYDLSKSRDIYVIPKEDE